MIEIQVAGAGAGKTYGLAERLAKDIEKESSSKKVYAITYTNNARNEIKKQLNECIGYIPDRVHIETVHSFLLNVIVYPLSPFVTGVIYSNTTTASLSANIKFKQKQKSLLKQNSLLHAEDTYSAARRIVDRQMSANKTKANRLKVDRALEILSCAIDRIYIDEAQDLDSTAFTVFEILGKSVADVYMVGDPKQAIKYPKEFISFLSKYSDENDDLVSTLPPINDTRRIPKKLLEITNRFCYEEQRQNSVSKIDGELKYIESTNQNYQTIIEQAIDSGNLVCIDKMCSSYETHGLKYDFPVEVCELVLGACGSFDPDIYLKAAHLRFYKDVDKFGDKKAASNFFDYHKVAYKKNIYALLMQSASKRLDDNTILVKSIDSAKGLEADDCMLILTPNTYKYLLQKSLKVEQRHNKEWNRIYVVLTRARKRFIIAVDHSLFSKQNYSINDVLDSIEGLGFDTL